MPYLKLGRPPNKDVEPKIKEILSKTPYITRASIKRQYKEITGKGVGFWTVDKALKELIKKDIVTEVVNSKELRKVAVYYLSDGRKRR